MVRSEIPWYKQLWRIKLTLVLVLAPLVFLPLPILVPSKASKCAYGILIMASYWMTEVIPMAVTSLLPIVIFPWLSVMDTKKACSNYFKDSNMLFFGGLMVAVAVEKWNLHKRVALRVLMLVGSKPRWLMFGFMTTTAFLSMWISNTATTAMMVPISHAVLTELENHYNKSKAAKNKTLSCSNKAFETDSETTKEKDSNLTRTLADSCIIHAVCLDGPSNSIDGPSNNKLSINVPSNITDNTQSQNIISQEIEVINDDKEVNSVKEWFDKVGRGMRLSIAYAANIGGTATLTGTAPNLVLKGQLDVLYGSGTGINFSSWFVFAFPNMLVSLVLAWLWLVFLFLGPKEIMKFFRRRRKEKSKDSATDVIKKEYEKLGKISFAEAEVLTLFVVLVLMWLTKHPEFVPGWASLLVPFGWVTDSCVAITIAILLFMLPSRWPNYLFFRRKSDVDEPGPGPPLLDWPSVHKHIPWNVLLLLGGGFAMAEASKESGLSLVIGQFFTYLQHLPRWGLVFILSTLTAAFTEVTSNVATATIFLPILAELASNLNINPLYLMLPVTISCSFAFMLPVATPPNALVFAYGNMRIMDMVKAGIVQNCVCLLVLQLATNTWGNIYFNLNSFPEWACSPKCNLINGTFYGSNSTGIFDSLTNTTTISNI